MLFNLPSPIRICPPRILVKLAGANSTKGGSYAFAIVMGRLGRGTRAKRWAGATERGAGHPDVDAAVLLLAAGLRPLVFSATNKRTAKFLWAVFPSFLLILGPVGRWAGGNLWGSRGFPSARRIQQKNLGILKEMA